MKIKLALLTLFLLLSLSNWRFYSQSKTIDPPTPPPNPLSDYHHLPLPKIKSTLPPILSSPNYILLDSATNTILLSKNPHQIIFPASITKLATAVTALNVYPLEELVTIKQIYQVGKTINLLPGQKFTVQSLVSALLVYSANDAAYSLAVHHPEGLDNFIDQMNLLSKKYNLTNTNFTNVDGVHHSNHYSTVYDLAQLGRISIKNSFVTQVVKNKNITVTDIDNTIQHQLQSTNELLNIVPEVEGLKSGWTPEAGGCFIGLFTINGHQIISVVAQSQDRFADTQKLISWSKQNIYWTDYQP